MVGEVSFHEGFKRRFDARSCRRVKTANSFALSRAPVCQPAATEIQTGIVNRRRTTTLAALTIMTVC
jgi:hypothetical protein